MVKEYVRNLTHTMSGLKVSGEFNEAAFVRATMPHNLKVDVTIDEETYTDVPYDVDAVNQVIEDYFMANVGDDEMSNTRYVADNGQTCPSCESSEVIYSTGALMAGEDVECLSCGASWKEVKELVGYSDLIKGDE